MVSTDSGADAALPTHLWSLREDVLVEEGPEQDRIVVVTKWAELTIDDVHDVVSGLLRRMSLGPISLENVVSRGGPAGQDWASPAQSGTPAGSGREWAELRTVLDLLSGSVVRSLGLTDGDKPLLSAVPISRAASLSVTDVDADRPVRLSRFAALRAADGELLLESPLAQYQVVLLRPVAAQVVTALSRASTVNEVAARLGIRPAVVAGVVGYLAGTGIVLLGDPRPTTPTSFAEDSDPVLLQWTHHDLMFHSRSRGGPWEDRNTVAPVAGEPPGPDSAGPVRSGLRLALYRPSVDDVARHDRPLTDLLEHAMLCDDLTDRPVSAQQLGELLFRAARIRSIAPDPVGTHGRYGVSGRPSVRLLGLYELEIYVSAHRCAGLARGTYRYDPRRHELTLVNESVPELDELLDGARAAARTSWQPSLLITLAARVNRTAWTSGGVGYLLMLTRAGALQQTLCLVANAMGLAACAPAVDQGDTTNNALRLDWPAEVGVGQLLVG